MRITLIMPDHLAFATCPFECSAVFHLLCAARQSQSLLPKAIHCACGKSAEWGKLVKSCYARREAIEDAKVLAAKPRRVRRLKASSQASADVSNASDSGGEEDER
jgi:hypothetical protein